MARWNGRSWREGILRRLVAVALILMAVAAPAGADACSSIFAGEFLAGSLGSAVGWASGFLAGRGLALAWDLESEPDQKDLVTVTTVVLAVTLGTSLGVSSAGSAYGEDGSEILAAGGALLGLIAGMAVEPLLAIGLSSVLPRGAMSSPVLRTAVEAVGVASMVFVPALLATAGFNLATGKR